jgi:hypothetical protein
MLSVAVIGFVITEINFLPPSFMLVSVQLVSIRLPIRMLRQGSLIRERLASATSSFPASARAPDVLSAAGFSSFFGAMCDYR